MHHYVPHLPRPLPFSDHPTSSVVLPLFVPPAHSCPCAYLPTPIFVLTIARHHASITYQTVLAQPIISTQVVRSPHQWVYPPACTLPGTALVAALSSPAQLLSCPQNLVHTYVKSVELPLPYLVWMRPSTPPLFLILHQMRSPRPDPPYASHVFLHPHRRFLFPAG